MERACLHRRYQTHFPNGRFSEVCQACYVIVCCGADPERLAAMSAQLEALRPINDVDICIFSGSKKCGSSEHSAHDLNLNYLYLFRDALKKGASRAFILEDDFIVEDHLRDDDVSEIVKFLRTHNPCVYGMGNFMLPTFSTAFARHQKSIAGMNCSHATFYDRTYMLKIVDFVHQVFANRIPSDFYCVDQWPELFKANTYRYYKPLITQIFPATENQTKGWTQCKPGLFAPLQTQAFICLLRILNLHKKTQPGWNIAYFVGTYAYFLVFVVILFALLVVLRQ